MKKVFLLGITLLVISMSSASAQIVWGIRAGASIPTSLNDNNYSMKGKFGLEIGPVLYYSFKDGLYLNAGVLYSMKTLTDEAYNNGERLDYSVNMSYIEIPLYLGSFIPIGKIQTYVQGGPYIGYNFSSNLSTDVNGVTGSIDISEKFNSINAGLGFMYGVNINRFKIEIGYQYGLTNFFKEDDTNTKLQSLFLGVSYVF